MSLERHCSVEELSARYNGESSSLDQVHIDGHLAQCPRCRAEWKGLERTVTMMRSLPKPVLPPDAAREIRTRIQAIREEPSWRDRLMVIWQRPYLLAGAAAACLVAIIANQQQSSTPTMEEVLKKGSSEFPGDKRNMPSREADRGDIFAVPPSKGKGTLRPRNVGSDTSETRREANEDRGIHGSLKEATQGTSQLDRLGTPPPVPTERPAASALSSARMSAPPPGAPMYSSLFFAGKAPDMSPLGRGYLEGQNGQERAKQAQVSEGQNERNESLVRSQAASATPLASGAQSGPIGGTLSYADRTMNFNALPNTAEPSLAGSHGQKKAMEFKNDEVGRVNRKKEASLESKEFLQAKDKSSVVAGLKIENSFIGQESEELSGRGGNRVGVQKVSSDFKEGALPERGWIVDVVDIVKAEVEISKMVGGLSSTLELGPRRREAASSRVGIRGWVGDVSSARVWGNVEKKSVLEKNEEQSLGTLTLVIEMDETELNGFQRSLAELGQLSLVTEEDRKSQRGGVALGFYRQEQAKAKDSDEREDRSQVALKGKSELEAKKPQPVKKTRVYVVLRRLPIKP